MMNVQIVLLKISCVSLVSLSLIACGSLPFTDSFFVDQKESYKRAYELPGLEVPPGLSAGQTRDEYDGGVRGIVSMPRANAIVKTTPLKEQLSAVELVGSGVDAHLLVRDSLRSTWRKVIGAFESLDYDIEDKNRVRSEVYLNIVTEETSGSMLSNLSFWNKADTVPYLVILERLDMGVAIRVLDKAEKRVGDKVASVILADLLAELTP